MTLTAVLLLAAAPAAPDLSPRDRGDLAVRARDILKRHCAACHGDKPRRGDVSVLDHPKLTAPAYPVPLVNTADPPKSLLLDLVRDGSMPPGGRPRPTKEEVKALADWVAAGAPGYPHTFDDRFAADAAFADWLARGDADKPATRYVSLAHLVRDGAAPPDLKDAEQKLLAALQRASGKDVPLVPADPSATVFRLDLRAAGWDKGDLFDRVEKGGVKNNAHPLTAFDVILLEYPFADATWAGDPGKNLTRLTGVRKVPVVRGDWLSEALAPGASLTTDVRKLVELLTPGDPPCGPRPGRFFGGPAAGPPESWYGADADDPAFKAEVVAGEGFQTRRAEVKAREPFKLRVTATRPLRLLALHVQSDGYTKLQVLERAAVTAETTLLGPRTNAPFSVTPSSDEDSNTDYFVLFASDVEVPTPTVLRSRHNPLCEDNRRQPISRFLFEPAGSKTDPPRLIRRVVPVTVRK
ncbi:MAG: cytochrome c [Gemmataceae bacterium]